MEGRNQLRATKREHAPTQLRNGIEGPQQRLRPELSERDDDLRLDRIDLPEEKRLARLDFFRPGIAVARRPALDDVGDVDLLPLQLNGPADLPPHPPPPAAQPNTP